MHLRYLGSFVDANYSDNRPCLFRPPLMSRKYSFNATATYHIDRRGKVIFHLGPTDLYDGVFLEIRMLIQRTVQ